MVELGHQQTLPLLIALPVRDVENGARHAQAGLLLVWDTLTAIQEPANLAVGPDDLELQLAAPRLRCSSRPVLANHVAVLGVHDSERPLQCQRLVSRQFRRSPQIRGPIELTSGGIVIVGPEPSSLARKAQPLGGLAQLGGRIPRARRCALARAVRAHR